jgi:hypothetical protein
VVAVAIVAAATVALGTAIRQTQGGLGTATPPFVGGYGFAADTAWLLLAVAVLALAVIGVPRLVALRARVPVVAPALWALTVTLGLAVNAARGGPDAWSAVFDLGPGRGEALNEYLPGLPAIDYGPRFFLDRFAELVPSQTVNVAGHPPGPLLLVDALGIRTHGPLAALCIGAGALSAPATYALSRTLGRTEREARVAGVLVAFSPVALLFGVTSFDWLYAALGAVAAALLVARPWPVRAAGAVAFAVAAFFSWALMAVGAWAALVVLQREGRRSAVAVAAGCAAAWAALNGALAVAYGYDPIGTLLATDGVYRNSVASIRPYLFWALGSPVAWGLMLGLPIAAAGVRAVVRRDPAAVALAAVLAIATLGGFTKAETERIWLIFVPLACAAAAPVLAGTRRPRLVLGALAAQALVAQVLFFTVW